MVTFGSKNPPIVLSIAGFDPSSGAGITADVKTAAAHGCFALACITALTVQSTQGVAEVHPIDAQVVERTLAALRADFEIAAIRVGMLGSGAVATAVASFLEGYATEGTRPVVVLDPILRASSGTALIDQAGAEVIRQRLVILADVVTPNLDEAAALTGVPVAGVDGMRLAAAAMHQLGAANVVVTGGHLDQPVDLLSIANPLTEIRQVEFPYGRIDSSSTHGTGCAFACSLACSLAWGKEIEVAVREAHEYVAESMRRAHPLGRGRGPLNHLYPLDVS